MRALVTRLAALFLALNVAGVSDAQGTPVEQHPVPVMPPGAPELRIGVCDLPPYSFTRPDGSWDGIAVQLWTTLASKAGIRYHFEPVGFAEMQDRLEASTLDAAATGISIIADRERRYNFTHAFESGGFVIASRASGAGGFTDSLHHLMTRELLTWVGILLGAVIFFGLLLTLMERRRNKQFPPTLRGVGEGLWWSITTLSTVGYGDRVPVTGAGKVLAGLWMLVAFGMMTLFSGVIAASLTVSRLAPEIRDVGALRDARVGRLDGSASGDLLDRLAVRNVTVYPTNEEGLEALRSHRINAYVGDEVSLRFLLREDRFDDLSLSTDELEQVFVGMGLADKIDSNTRDVINYHLLKTTESSSWAEYLRRFLGSSGA